MSRAALAWSDFCSGFVAGDAPSAPRGPDAAAPGGSTGAGGTGGTGNAFVMNPSSSYAQNSGSTAAFPYPQGHTLPNCTFPAYSTDDVETAYLNWKAKYFVNGTVIRPENGNDTVSEGIGYGMLIGVFMNDQPMFDTLWSYAKAHPSNKNDGLMTFCIPSGSGSCTGAGAATDADEDMAYALLMASKQWSGGSYGSDAATLIGNIFTHEVSGNILEGGDGFNNANELDPSYFAPSYYRAFATFDRADSDNWMSTCSTSRYSILAAAIGRGRPGSQLGESERYRNQQRRLHARDLLRLRRLPHPVPHRHRLLHQRRGARPDLRPA